MFDEAKREYLPKLVSKYSRKFGAYGVAGKCNAIMRDTEQAVLTIIGERNFKTAYLNGKSKEANDVFRALLDDYLELFCL